MERNLFRRNKSNILFLIIYLLACILLYNIDFFNTSNKDSEFHLNLLTINSVFLGFLFTGLGIMVGFTDKKIIKQLNTAGYMDNYYNSIYFGLLLFIISSILSALGVAIEEKYITALFLLIQQISFVGGILFFIKSIFGLMKLISFIRKEE
jgi:hypothetical protein